MNRRYDHTEGRFGGHRTMNGREDGFHTLPGGPGGGFHTLPGGPGSAGFHTLPEGHGGGGFHTLPERFGPPGRPGMPGGPGMPGRPGMPGGPGMPDGHGRPPMPPSPEFMKERIEEADLAGLLMLAGRMVRRPEGEPAQGQNLVLSILAGREALSQRALQQMLGVQPGSLSEILTKLERKGFLTREKAEDRRGNLLRITEAGRAALPGEDAAETGADDRFSALTGEQQEQLAALLRALLNDWADRFAALPRCPGRIGYPRGDRLPPPDLTTKV